MADLTIDNLPVKIHERSGYVSLTDMAKESAEDQADEIIRRWLRTTGSLQFFQEWERHRLQPLPGPDFSDLILQAGQNAFTVSVKKLVGAGATGIFAVRGRYGGTYAHIDWAIHFANWLSPRFYVLTIEAFRQMHDLGNSRYELYARFSRELAAKNYALITERPELPSSPVVDSVKNRLPGKGDEVAVTRQLNQVDADILNLALWNMTAQVWRSTCAPKDAGDRNMRDYATPEELQTVAALQVIIAEARSFGMTNGELLSHLQVKAKELLTFYCDTQDKQYVLELARDKRGW